MKRKIQFRSFKTRLVSWFLLVALLPLAIVSIVIYHQRVHYIKKSAFNKLRAICTLKVKQTTAWLEERVGALQIISEDFEIRDLEGISDKEERTQDDTKIISKARKLLIRYLDNYSDYQEIFIIDSVSGIIKISTNTLSEGLNKSKEPYFTEPMHTKEIYIKDVYFSKTINAPSMLLSIPICCFSHNCEHITGILVARLDLKHSLYALLLDRTGMGKTGETLIVNKDVLALNELRWYDQAPLRLKIEAEPALYAAQGKTGITESDDYRGEKVLAAYTHIPITKWGFVTKQDTKEVYAPVRGLLWNLLILFMISVMIAYGVAIFLARNLALPVVEMAKISKKIREGDLSARNRAQSADELGYLAESFNNMADSILSQIEIIKKTEGELRKEKKYLDEEVRRKTVALRKELAERKQVEEALRLQAEITANMSEGVYLVRANDSAIIYSNRKFEEMFGYGSGEIVGKHISICNAPTEKSPEETVREITDIVDVRGEWGGGIQTIKKDGTLFWSYISVSSFNHREHGRVLVGIHTDITERKRVGEEKKNSKSNFSEPRRWRSSEPYQEG